MSDGTRKALGAWTEITVARARSVVAAASLLALLALIYAILGLEIDTDTTDMISGEVPFRQNAIAFDRAFPRFAKPIVAVVEAPIPEQAEREAGALAAALRGEPESFGAVDYLPAEPFFLRHGLLYLGLAELEALSERLATAQPLLAVLAEDPTLRGLAAFLGLALGDAPDEAALEEELGPLLRDMARVTRAAAEGAPAVLSWRRTLDGEDGSGAVREIVLAEPRLDHTTLAPGRAAIERLRALAREVGIDEDRLLLTGDAVIGEEELQSVRSNALIAAGLTAVGVTVLLIVGLRSFRLIAATLVTLAIGLVITAALALLMVGQLNLLSVTFAVLFVGLGVDFGIHLVLRFRESLIERREHPIAAAVQGVAGALTLAALCAMTGFLSFVPTDYRGLAELGLISAAGMVVALVTSLTVLPALLALLAPRPERAGAIARSASERRFQLPPRTVLLGTALLALAALPALPDLAFDFNPLNLKDPESESVRTFHILADDPATSPYVVDVLAADFRAAREVAKRLEEVPEVGTVVSLARFVPDHQDEKLALIESLAFFLGPVLMPAVTDPLSSDERRLAFMELRDTVAGAANARPEEGPVAALASALSTFALTSPGDERLRTLENRLVGTLPDLLERLSLSLEAGPVAAEDLPDSLQERWQTDDGRRRLLVRPAERIVTNGDIDAFAAAVLEAWPDATGTPIIIREAGRAVIKSFETASWLALGGIALILIVVLRRVSDVVLVLLPLALAVLFTAATAVVFGLSLNFANVIVLPLLLGLGVSGAIHVVVRDRQEGAGASLAGTSTPRAVLFSALTTIASFGSLAVSAHRGLASMGELLTIAILWSLFCTLVVLPSLLALRRNPVGHGRLPR
jgi:hopanoid biosynthesis associated RND transporter like protein HpnN